MTLWLLALMGLTAATADLGASAPPAVRPPSLATDTVLALRPGDAVLVTNLSGHLSVEARDGDALRLATERAVDEVTVRRDGSRVLVTAGGRARGRPMDVVLQLPAWVDLEVEAVDLDVEVQGLEGDVAIGTITGDIHVRGTGGRLVARTVDGEVEVENPRGPVEISAHDDDIDVRGPRGPVNAVSLDGDITITGSDAPSLRAETQSGDIDFAGAIHAGGRYAFYLHSGDVRLELPASLGARVRASTFHGDFQSDFPVVVSGFTSGRAFDFTVGDGRAEIVVEVFDGEILLSRAP